MISVKICRDGSGIIRKYTISGHANYSEYGDDLVCCAISILAHNVLASLVEVCEIEENSIDYAADKNKGYLDVNLPRNLEKSKLDKSQILLKSLEVGVKSVIESYPGYVTLEYGEV